MGAEWPPSALQRGPVDPLALCRAGGQTHRPAALGNADGVARLNPADEIAQAGPRTCQVDRVHDDAPAI